MMIVDTLHGELNDIQAGKIRGAVKRHFRLRAVESCFGKMQSKRGEIATGEKGDLHD